MLPFHGKYPKLDPKSCVMPGAELAGDVALTAGAYGGRITPSMMLGSTLGIVFGTIWAITIAPVSLGMSAFVGAVVFLGLAQKMPMTSCVFMLELSRFSVEMLFPIALTMGTALMVEQIIQSKLNSAK